MSLLLLQNTSSANHGVPLQPIYAIDVTRLERLQEFREKPATGMCKIHLFGPILVGHSWQADSHCLSYAFARKSWRIIQ